MFESRELKELRRENDILRKKNSELHEKVCKQDVELFNVYGLEAMNELTERLNLSSAQESELHLLFSIKRARLCGVPENEILHNLEEIEKFFTSEEV